MGKYPTNNVQSKQFGYGQQRRPQPQDEYIQVNLPASVEQQLNQGAYIMIDEAGNPIKITVEKPEMDELNNSPVATEQNLNK